MRVQMEHMADNLKNPFDEMYNWIKGETYDIMALADSVAARDYLEKQIKKLEQKKRD